LNLDLSSSAFGEMRSSEHLPYNVVALRERLDAGGHMVIRKFFDHDLDYTGRIRLSTDCRYQSASKPIDER